MDSGFDKKRLFDKLIDIAKLQNYMLSLRFDWQSRRSIEDYDEGEYIDAMESLEEKKEFLRGCLAEIGIYPGIVWWEVPIEDTIELLIKNLEGESVDGDLRTERQVLCEETPHGSLLYIKERGHLSEFLGEKHTIYGRSSKYSEEEQAQILSDYNKKIDFNESMNIATMSGPVYSEEQHKVYDSAQDFYSSCEHQLQRQADADFVQKSLYIETETDEFMVYSNSRDYTGYFSLAGFDVDPCGVLINVDFRGLKKISAGGEAAEYAGMGIEELNERILCAAYFSLESNIEGIYAESIDEDFFGEATYLARAMASSAVFTLIAGKLRFLADDYKRPLSEEEFEGYKALFAKFGQGEPLEYRELIAALEAINGSYLPFTDQMAFEIKACLLLQMILKQQDGMSAVFYSSVCADMTFKATMRYRSVAIFQVLIQSAATAADIYLKIGDKLNAGKYAEYAIAGCDLLQREDPFDSLLSMRRDCEKMLKKASKKGWLF